MTADISSLTVEIDDHADAFTSSAFIEGGPTHDELPSNDLECVVCGKPLEYGGRGRKPKFCDEHRGSKSAGSNAKVSSSNSDPTNTPAIRRIKVEVAGTVRGGAAALKWFEPFDSAVLGINSDRIGETVGNVASRNPKFKASVDKFLKASSYPELIFLMITILQPILVHHGVIPSNPAARIEMEEMIKQQYKDMVAASGMGF